MNEATRTALLTAIARSRNWLDCVAEGTETLAETSLAEHLAERHVRFLTSLAFVSPRVIDAIADGCAPADLIVSTLARTLHFSWSQQDRQLSLK